MIRFHKLALGAAFVAAIGMNPSSIMGNVGKKIQSSEALDE
jgi:hypothetical protein